MYQNIFYERGSEQNSNGYIHCWDDHTGYRKIPNQRYGYKLDEYGNHKTIYGDRCKMVRRWSKEDQDSGLIYESDLHPEMRYLIDNYTNSDVPSDKHRILFFDIEVESTSGFPYPNNPIHEITAISHYDNINMEYFVHILDKDMSMENSRTEQRGSQVNVKVYESEEKLLNGFLEFYTELQPTVISGWNSQNFDVPYIYNRLKLIFDDDIANSLSPIGIVTYNDYQEKFCIAGVSSLDYMLLYKKFSLGERVSYSLDAIAKQEVKEGKIKYSGTLDSLYKQDKDKFIEYSVHDTRLIKMIDDKLKFIELTFGVSHKGHIPYEDVYYSSRYIDGAILTHLKRHELVAPNKPNNKYNDSGEELFSGAYVKDPTPGLYSWIIDLDAESMYPRNIMAVNISPETKQLKVKNWFDIKTKFGVSGGVSFDKITDDTNFEIMVFSTKENFEMDKVKFLKMMEDENLCIASNGVIYKKVIEKFDGVNTIYEGYGVVPQILHKWFDERVFFRNEARKYNLNDEKYNHFDRLQKIQKVLLNSIYGVLGLPTFRFYDLDNAEAVTTIGVDLIKFAERTANFYFSKKLGVSDDNVIYIDTDSIFFSLEKILQLNPKFNEMTNDDIVNEILVLAKDIQTFINKMLDVFAKKTLLLDKHGFKFKQELVAKRGLWVIKKRYALNVINDGGKSCDKLDVKGMDVVRTSFPKLFREFMRKILIDILNGNEKEHIDKLILELKETVKTVDFVDICRPTSVKEISKYCNYSHSPFQFVGKGTPVHVKAAISYNDYLRHYNLDTMFDTIKDASKVKWAYLSSNNPYKLPTLAFKDNDEDPKEILEYVEKYIDREKIFESDMDGKLQDFYDVLKWGKIPTKVNQNFSKFF